MDEIKSELVRVVNLVEKLQASQSTIIKTLFYLLETQDKIRHTQADFFKGFENAGKLINQLFKEVKSVKSRFPLDLFNNKDIN